MIKILIMKKSHILFCMLCFLVLGCLEDEGNYDYRDIKAPEWRTGESPFGVSGRQHETMELRGRQQFTWKTDSAEREKEVRYEWRLNDAVIATEADVDVPVDSVIKWANITKFPKSGEYLLGSFTVIDKEVGTHFVKLVTFYLYSTRNAGDWYVLTEKGNGGECYFVKRGLIVAENREGLVVQDSFSNINGVALAGKPVFLGYTRTAREVGPLGSVTIMTDKEMYEVDAATFMIHAGMEDLFESGVPAGFSPVARTDAWEDYYDTGLCTFLANKDGKLYRRQMTANNLGGKFIDTPYEIDAKGYKITKFGSHRYGYTSPIPCLDEDNNRVIMIAFNQKSTGGPWDYGAPSYMVANVFPVKRTNSLTDCPPVWGFEQGTKVLNIGYMQLVSEGFTTNYNMYSVIYNDASKKTWCGEFIVNPVDGSLVQQASGMPMFGMPGGKSSVKECPVQLSDDALILVSCSSYNKNKSYFIYADGNQVNYLAQNYNYANLPMITDFPEKITYIGYGTVGGVLVGGYNLLAVGGENGTLCFYNITNRDRPVLMETMKFDGKITMAKEIATSINDVDEY